MQAQVLLAMQAQVLLVVQAQVLLVVQAQVLLVVQAQVLLVVQAQVLLIFQALFLCHSLVLDLFASPPLVFSNLLVFLHLLLPCSHPYFASKIRLT